MICAQCRRNEVSSPCGMLCEKCWWDNEYEDELQMLQILKEMNQ